MAKSRIYLTFNSVPVRYSSIGIRFNNNPTNNTIYEQFQYLRVTPTGVTIKYAVKEGATVNESAKNYHDAVKADQSIDNPGKFNFGYSGNVVWIEANDSCIKFESNIVNPAISLEFNNEDCSVPPLAVTSEEFIQADTDQCNFIKYSFQTNNILNNVSSPLIIERGSGNEKLTLIDIHGQSIAHYIDVPQKLTSEGIIIQIQNSATGADVQILNEYPLLELQYKIDAGEWKTFNEFFLPLGMSYTLYVKDQYGCQISEVFTIDQWYADAPTIQDKKYNIELHELNVGKYLNLFGKQHTMKLGFVCNAEPNAIKIFKHIQMILNVDYAIKNIKVKTSTDQERFIPGEHIVYRIREGMHSVPLKNPSDYADLRGSWAYAEIEIESINNHKVDLFSAIMHLRKSLV